MLISILLFIPLINFTAQLDNEVIIYYTWPFNIIRYMLICVSLLTLFWAFFFNYDTLSFFGIRQILNAMKKKKFNHEVKKSGLLGIVRHPMYTALIIFLWCQTFSMVDIIVNTLLTIYIVIGTILEEKKLVLEFGNAYIEYQKEVPMLIPLTKNR
ncbi:MAG: isoprenylcysteine carboxylmethyltransferase family protein [Eubacteriales bacterium]